MCMHVCCVCYNGVQRLQGGGNCSSEGEVGWPRCDDGPEGDSLLSSRRPGFSLRVGSGSAWAISVWASGCEEERWERDAGEGGMSDVSEEDEEG